MKHIVWHPLFASELHFLRVLINIWLLESGSTFFLHTNHSRRKMAALRQACCRGGHNKFNPSAVTTAKPHFSNGNCKKTQRRSLSTLNFIQKDQKSTRTMAFSFQIHDRGRGQNIIASLLTFLNYISLLYRWWNIIFFINSKQLHPS